MTTLILASEPWWTDAQSGLVGAILGGGLGSLAGLIGAAVGIFAPRGRYKRVLLPAFFGMLAIGPIALALGGFAVLIVQPYAVYYPLLLVGTILTGTFANLWFMPIMVYQMAERRAEAAGDREGPLPPAAAQAMQMQVQAELWSDGRPAAVWSWRIALAATLAGVAALALGVWRLVGAANMQAWIPFVLFGSILALSGICSIFVAFAMKAAVRQQRVMLESQRLAAGELRRS